MPSRISPTLCARCKGSRRLCGRPRCPIVARLASHYEFKVKYRKTELFGASPPSVFVGEYGYPTVKLGPLVPPFTDDEKASLLERPNLWYGMKLEDIIKMRCSLIRSNFTLHVRKADRTDLKLLELTRELALSSKPVDSEVLFEKPPRPRLSFDGIIAPIGPSGRLRDFKLAENPYVPRKVDSLADDFDVKAFIAVKELYRSGFDVYYINRLLSLGMLGRRGDRRLVPTRWSITATDSMVGDYLLEKVRDFEEVSEILLYTSSYLDNHYYVLLLPGSYAFEMIEIWLPRSVWVKEAKPFIGENFELTDGKWQKADVDGGYKAMRLAALEHLYRIKRQAMVFSIREIGPGYYAPVGVWQVRESMRKAFESKPKKFDDIKDALEELKRKVRTPFKMWYKKAQLPKIFMFQKRITNYVTKLPRG